MSPSSGQKARRALTLQFWGGIVNYCDQVRIVSSNLYEGIRPCVTITKAGPWNSQKWPSAASILWRGHPGISSGLAANVFTLVMGPGGVKGVRWWSRVCHPAGSCHVWCWVTQEHHVPPIQSSFPVNPFQNLYIHLCQVMRYSTASAT